MENLNKENFWNAMQKSYPLAMADFCEWIDAYKKKTEWNNLFNDNYQIDTPYPASNGLKRTKAPKFHDLPLAMQMGIWNEYLSEHTIDTCKSVIENFLYATQQGMEDRHNAELDAIMEKKNRPIDYDDIIHI